MDPSQTRSKAFAHRCPIALYGFIDVFYGFLGDFDGFPGDFYGFPGDFCIPG